MLLVDDEETIRLAVRTVLGMHNYQVLTAADGVHAMEIYSQKGNNIALVLTDLMMSVMDGMALTRALRWLRPELPVIVSTGRGDETRLAELEAMDIRAILDKPYATDALFRALDQALRRPEASWSSLRKTADTGSKPATSKGVHVPVTEDILRGAFLRGATASRSIRACRPWWSWLCSSEASAI